MAPGWREDIRWACVYNLDDYPDGTSETKIRMTMAEAQENGGGVIYLLAGDYILTDDLYLVPNVVIRGAEPTIQEAKSEEFRPPTRLIFPQYEPTLSAQGTSNETAFKSIKVREEDTASNVGLVFLDINRAAISWAGNPDTGTMHNRLIFGIRSNNVAKPDPY